MAFATIVLDGDRLILTAKTHEMDEDHERKLVWQRAGARVVAQIEIARMERKCI